MKFAVFKICITYNCPRVYLIHKIILHVYIILSIANVFVYYIIQISPQNLDYSAKNVSS